jgi:cytochrome b
MWNEDLEDMNSTNAIKVWDPAVRVFHWALVLSFFVSYFLVEDGWLTVHLWAGYTVLGLVLFRIAWGFLGSPHARFADFVYAPATVIAHLKAFARLRTRRYLGHNPAGGAMIVLLLSSLIATTLSGVAVTGSEPSAGALAAASADVRENGEHWLEEMHEFFANFTLALVFVHVAGVIVESVLHRENLVRAMFTGRKRRSEEAEEM